MEIWQIVLCGASLLTALVLLLRLVSLRASLRDIAEDLDDVLRTDTNAQLCVLEQRKLLRDKWAKLISEGNPIERSREVKEISDADI